MASVKHAQIARDYMTSKFITKQLSISQGSTDTGRKTDDRKCSAPEVLEQISTKNNSPKVHKLDRDKNASVTTQQRALSMHEEPLQIDVRPKITIPFWICFASPLQRLQAATKRPQQAREGAGEETVAFYT